MKVHDLSVLNERLLARCLERLDALEAGGQAAALLADLDALRDLPAVPFEACEHVPGQISSTALVRYRLVDYSVWALLCHQGASCWRCATRLSSRLIGFDAVDAMNAAIRRELDRLNHAPMACGETRRAVFEANERAVLQPPACEPLGVGRVDRPQDRAKLPCVHRTQLLLGARRQYRPQDRRAHRRAHGRSVPRTGRRAHRRPSPQGRAQPIRQTHPPGPKASRPPDGF